MTEEQKQDKKEEEKEVIEKVDENDVESIEESKEKSPDVDEVKDILKISKEKSPSKIKEIIEEPKEIPKKEETTKEVILKEKKEENMNPIFALRTTANREDQVLDFVTSNVDKKGLEVYSLISPHGLRGYIFLEAKDRQSAEESFQGVPYARGLLPSLVKYEEIEHMLEQVKREINIQKNDIVEIISGPFKRENAKVTRIDQHKEEVIVELLESAIPIPITVRLDSVKVIRRESEPEEKKE